MRKLNPFCWLMIPLFISGCVTTTENADTFKSSSVLAGSVMTVVACQPLDTSIWVTVDGRGECVRYFHAGLKNNNEAVLAYFHGDRTRQNFFSDHRVLSSYRRDADPEILSQKAAEKFATYQMPYIWVSRPGVYGSSGDHSERRRPRESKILNAALEGLKDRYRISEWILTGQSGGGHVVASLLTMRNDITCAVSTSGVVSVRERSGMHGWSSDITGYNDYFDPIDHVAKIPANPNRQIFIVGDPRDSNVQSASQKSYAEAVRRAGHKVHLMPSAAGGKSYHALSETGHKVATWCHQKLDAEEIQRKLPQPGGTS